MKIQQIFKRTNKKHIPENAYTLVELMVTISIASILVGVSIPILANTQTEARDITLKQDLKRISEEVELSFTYETGYDSTLEDYSVSPNNELFIYIKQPTTVETPLTESQYSLDNTEVPEIPVGLTPALARSGTLAGFCLEGYNDYALSTQNWFYIDTETNTITQGRCDEKWK
jgi:prepilin-type N-terminal cleavage/methylation domain-containing protein